MKKILITGGPVHAYLDDVKIISNRFKGGLMCALAQDLASYDTQITYLCAPSVGAKVPEQNTRIKVIQHQGFSDYREQVLEIAPLMDCVILGAAVANLIPFNPIKGKFPSHNFKVGDIIRLNFTIAPRVIDEVKQFAPHAQLFGFKLLSGASHRELISSAYDSIVKSHATAIFANDTKNLQQKFAVTKESGVHPLSQQEMSSWIWDMLNDVYYQTIFMAEEVIGVETAEKIQRYINRYREYFQSTKEGRIFGCVAIRHKSGFITTTRGKSELDKFVFVRDVDHERKFVYVASPNTKASLNAPLLAQLFENPLVDVIVHYHEQITIGLQAYKYAPPGTVRDTTRPNTKSFGIEGHGTMLLFDKEGRQL